MRHNSKRALTRAVIASDRLESHLPRDRPCLQTFANTKLSGRAQAKLRLCVVSPVCEGGFRLFPDSAAGTTTRSLASRFFHRAARDVKNVECRPSCRMSTKAFESPLLFAPIFSRSPFGRRRSPSSAPRGERHRPSSRVQLRSFTLYRFFLRALLPAYRLFAAAAWLSTPTFISADAVLSPVVIQEVLVERRCPNSKEHKRKRRRKEKKLTGKETKARTRGEAGSTSCVETKREERDGGGEARWLDWKAGPV